jgi:hypothetical protein
VGYEKKWKSRIYNRRTYKGKIVGLEYPDIVREGKGLIFVTPTKRNLIQQIKSEIFLCLCFLEMYYLNEKQKDVK